LKGHKSTGYFPHVIYECMNLQNRIESEAMKATIIEYAAKKESTK